MRPRAKFGTCDNFFLPKIGNKIGTIATRPLEDEIMSVCSNMKNCDLVAFQIVKDHADTGNPDNVAAFFTVYCSGTLQPTNITDCLVSEAKETLKLGLYAGNIIHQLSFRCHHFLFTALIHIELR